MSIRTLGFVSFYFADLPAAIDFYCGTFDEPDEAVPAENRIGWRMGDTWLTFFAGEENPRNGEFAIEVDSPAEVDRLYQAFTKAGATPCREPQDTRMYEPMRYCCVDDQFGVRIDVYHPLSGR